MNALTLKKKTTYNQEIAYIQAEVLGGTDTLYRALNLFKRKSFQIAHLSWQQPDQQKPGIVEMTLVKTSQDNPHCPKQLLSKLIGFREISRD